MECNINDGGLRRKQDQSIGKSKHGIQLSSQPVDLLNNSYGIVLLYEA